MTCIAKAFRKHKIKRMPTLPGSNHIALIVGHTHNTKGAFSEYLGEYEYEYNSRFANILKREIQRQGLSCTIHYRDDGGITGAYLRAMEAKPIAIMELHFNAFNGRVQGAEVLINERDDEEGVNERLFAQKMLDAMVMVLNNRNRGLKSISSGSERGFFNLSKVVSIPSILLEPFFGDNMEDARNFDLKRGLVAMSLARALKDYVNGR